MVLLAHHPFVTALPAFGPVLIVCAVLAVHALRTRRSA
jgi:hypothetical protein